MVWFAYCVLFYFHVATLEINTTGVVFGKDLLEKDESYFLISEEKSKSIMRESGKLSSELAFIYIYFSLKSYSKESMILEKSLLQNT